MTFITPAGRPLYEGVLPRQDEQQAQPKPAPDAQARGGDSVTLSAAARAYLESIQTKRAQPVREEPKPQVDTTV